MWRVRREEAETVEAVIAGVADIAAGRHHTEDEVDAEIRRRLDHLGRTELWELW
jgi:predicted transcriptional regulator